MKIQNRFSTFFLVPVALMSLLAISACSKSAESKCQEMTGTGSSKTEAGSIEEQVMRGCLALAEQLPDAFNREYDAWKAEQDKMKK